MSIDQVKYYCYFLDVPFGMQKTFLKNLVEHFPQVRIPYIELLNLHPDIIECLDRYIYIPDTIEPRPVLQRLTRHFGSANITYLSKIRERDLDQLQMAAVSAGSPTLTPGNFYQILVGPWTNLIVKVDSLLEEQQALCLYQVFNETRKIVVPFSDLKPAKGYIPPTQSFTNLTEYQSMTAKKAIVMDGDNVLYRAFHGYDTVYRAPTKDHPYRRFIGAAHGFFFKTLSFRQLYPEFELHVVFDGFDVEKATENPDYKAGRQKLTPQAYKAMNDNADWIKRFLRAAGIHTYHFQKHEGDDVVGALVRQMEQQGYSEIMIHSADTDFYQCLTPAVSLLQPKKSYRDAPHRVFYEEGLETFEVARIEQINWIRALTGDFTDNIISINKFNRANKIKGLIQKRDVVEHIRNARTVADVHQALAPLPNYTRFMETQYDVNLKLLTLKQVDALDPNLDTYRVKAANPTDEFTPYYDAQVVKSLLEEAGLYAELEMFQKTSRILCSLW